MNEKLKALLESTVLSDENQTVLKEAFDAAVEEAVTAQTQDVMRAAITLIDESIQEQLQPLSEEIRHARNLEVDYAQKIVDFKESYAQKQEEALAVKIQEAVAEEMEGIEQDIEEAKKNTFGKQLFEQFKTVYEQMQFNEGADGADLATRLSEAEEELAVLKREKVMDEVLEGISGKKRVIAESILENVATENLADRFAGFRDMILAQKITESTTEDSVVEEGDKGTAEQPEGTVVLENEDLSDDAPADPKAQLNESAADAKAQAERDKRIARSLERIKF